MNVFIDDNRDNFEGAKRVETQAFFCKGSDKILKKLRELEADF